VLGFCEYSNALSGSIKCGEFLGYLLALEEGPCPVELGAHTLLHFQNAKKLLYK